ncbi:C39 family peptidase [Desulfosporosinus nitroreducens]|uniref:C39 family peptidase n=1 Tax=Desulfosporosinus nitroreducens TaxID=2018668 RepID=UPI00207C507D|nr:C39 family peptidase [Desulfosporosinus nitroreducens]MCO1604476.1 C39 family peptidase [Desulfosporosinus nitroreducens]
MIAFTYTNCQISFCVNYHRGWSGSYHSLIPGAAKAFGLQAEGCSAKEPQKIVDALSSGKLVVALISKGHFTSSGHFIVLRGVTTEGKILVADPASKKRSEQEWNLSIILDEAHKSAGAGGPFWIISQ